MYHYAEKPPQKTTREKCNGNLVYQFTNSIVICKDFHQNNLPKNLGADKAAR